jgi:hypothetical protein
MYRPSFGTHKQHSTRFLARSCLPSKGQLRGERYEQTPAVDSHAAAIDEREILAHAKDFPQHKRPWSEIFDFIMHPRWPVPASKSQRQAGLARMSRGAYVRMQRILQQ